MNLPNEPSTSAARPKVRVVVPAYDGGQLLLDCLASLAASRLPPASVIVVDNASADGSTEQARSLFPWVRIIRNPTNLGFGRACNQGIEQAGLEDDAFVLLLNQDARLEPETLEQMVEFANRNPRAAVVGAKTLSSAVAADGAPLLLYNGAWRRWLPLWQRIPGIGRSSRDATACPRKVDYVWGHAMLLRCRAVREVGGFDPRFFMYYEDLDLCLRMQAAGWEVWCDSRAVVWHAVRDGPRANASEAWRWKMKVESARSFHRKYYAWPLSEVMWCLSTLREASPLLLEGHFRAARHLGRAWWQVVRRGPTRHDA